MLATPLKPMCSHRFSYKLMAWLARPHSDLERSECKASWTCPKNKVDILENFSTENVEALKNNGCVKNVEKIELGDLETNDKEGLYWVEVGKKSQTCKVDAKKIQE